MTIPSLPKRYSLWINYIMLYLIISFLIRLGLYIWSYNSMDFSIINLFRIFLTGLMFDIGASLFFSLFYSVYLFIFPQFWIGNWFDKIMTYFTIFIMLIISVFSFLAEIPFWEEFNTRFNFIAVDYLIYTYEVFENINESYPLPLLIGGLLLVIYLIIYFWIKRKIFQQTFNDKISWTKRLMVFLPVLILTLFYIYFIKNNQAEWSNNLYENELSKNGTYSFMAAFWSNELDFKTFYQNLDEKKAFSIINQELKQTNSHYIGKEYWDISRQYRSDSIENKPNIVLICIESLSAEFMARYGNSQNLTPHLDALLKESINFSNMYATGTRTVRGMEALTLSVPPTPGNSIVRRPENNNLFSINTVVKPRGYTSYFIYGGDGYFDNMNNFFGGQGFKIIDRNRGNPLSDDIHTERINIEDKEVKFENAWGISDEDIYTQLTKQQDKNFKNNKSSLYFVMTTSNHKPYTYPKGKIDIPEGSREGAVKYTDYAIGEYIKQAKTKPWFKNTIFIIVADHCANSAGKWEINVNKHHIPAMIYNSGLPAIEVNKLVSQIDLMPTVFSLLRWNYVSEFYGKDIFTMQSTEERALIGNYRTLGLLKNDLFTEINDRRQVKTYSVNNKSLEMKPINTNQDILKNLTISYYQTASLRYKNGWMKQQ